MQKHTSPVEKSQPEVKKSQPHSRLYWATMIAGIVLILLFLLALVAIVPFVGQ